MYHCLPVEQHEFILVVDAEVPSRGNVSDTHRVEPVDVTAGPLGPGQLQTPKGAGLRRDGAALIDHNAEGWGEKEEISCILCRLVT